MINYHEDPQECKNELISAALSAGGYDNVTVAVASIMMEGEEEEDDIGWDTLANSNKEAQPEEDLSTTIRSEAIGRRSKKHLLARCLLVLLLLLIGAGVYVYYTIGFENFQNEITITINKIYNNIKTLHS
jgi:hypothetical protein